MCFNFLITFLRGPTFKNVIKHLQWVEVFHRSYAKVWYAVFENKTKKFYFYNTAEKKLNVTHVYLFFYYQYAHILCFSKLYANIQHTNILDYMRPITVCCRTVKNWLQKEALKIQFYRIVYIPSTWNAFHLIYVHSYFFFIYLLSNLQYIHGITVSNSGFEWYTNWS